MKCLLYSPIFLFAGFLLSFDLAAQKKVAELTVAYDYSVINSEAANKPANSINGTNIIYIKGNLVRSEMESPMFTSSTIYDSKTGEAVILKEVSGQKLLIHLSATNWKEMNKPFDGINFIQTNESKTIAGYKCMKAVGKTKSGMELIVYYTTDIVPDNKDYNPKFRNLDGLPLEYELLNDKYKIRYIVNKINLNPVLASKFDIPKAGYREMSYEESRKL